MKLGVLQKHIRTDAMIAGTNYEHRILKAAGAEEMDKQLLCEGLRLRVNLDGNTGHHIIECKTYLDKGDGKPWKPKKAYRDQVQAQMVGAMLNGWSDVTAEIVAYPLTQENYGNFFLELDPAKITRVPVELDPQWMQTYLERLRILADALKRGVFP